jgi:hypothetical protein
MNERDLVVQASSYLQVFAGSYRSGVSLSLIEELKAALNTKRCVFVFLYKENEERILDSKHVDLLDKAISKGLGLNIDKQVKLKIEDLSEFQLGISSLKDLCEKSKATRVIFLGKHFSALLEKVDEYNLEKLVFAGIPSIVTESLIEIESNSAIKKKFWLTLKEFI